MKNLKTAFISFILLATAIFLLGGCTASEKDLATYKNQFITKTEKLIDVNTNTNSVLAQVREQAKKGMKRTEVINNLDQGKSVLELMQEDFSTSQVPKEMEPLKALVLKYLDTKLKAFDDLNMYYDLANPSASDLDKQADQKLAEADKLVTDIKAELDKLKK